MVSSEMRIALGQINTTVGDMAGNVARMVDAAREAAGRNAEIVVFPELAVTGYPPRDLMEKPSFVERAEQERGKLVRTGRSPVAERRRDEDTEAENVGVRETSRWQ